MPCLNLTTNSTDEPRFIDLITGIISGAIVTHHPPDVRIYKIDHWFDHKWLAFSGKLLGALGVWAKFLTVPPFVVNRVIEQWRYVRSEASGTYHLIAPGPNIHHRGRSGDNVYRSVKKIVPDAALFWYSGDTAETGRGSLMGYIPIEKDHWPWFLAFARDGDWRVARRKNIQEYEVRMFREAGDRVRSAEQSAAGPMIRKPRQELSP